MECTLHSSTCQTIVAKDNLTNNRMPPGVLSDKGW